MNKDVSKNEPISDYEKIIKKLNWPLWPHFTEQDKNAVEKVIKSNRLFASGDSKQLFEGSEVKAFEDEFAEYLGIGYARAVGNGTQGLHLALATLGIGVNDEIITSPYTFISTASCALMQNAVPIFADIEPNSLALSAKKVEEKITQRTKAIIVIHMLGYPADVFNIKKVASKHGLALIEDASHAPGAQYAGKMVGTLGDIAVFSLHQRKNLCVGDGGIVVTNNEKFASRLYRLRSFGHDELSYNYRMTEFAGAIGRTRLQQLDDENEIRRQNATYLDELLKDIPGITVRKPNPADVGVYYALLLEYDQNQFGVSLDNFIKLVRNEGVPFNRTYTPLHRHPHFNPTSNPARGCPWKWKLYDNHHINQTNYKDLKFPVAEEYCDNRLIELPVHPPVGEKEMHKVYKAVEKVFKLLVSD